MNNDKTNTGGLWKNDRRTKDTHPQATGSALIECPHCNKATDYFVDGYTNSKDDGTKWQRIKFKAKDKQQSATQAQPVGNAEDDQEIPF